MQVRDAESSERREVAACLGRAFEDDPVSAYLLPRREGRARDLARFYAVAIDILAAHGQVLTVSELRGAAVWQAPRPPRPSRAVEAWNGLRMAWALGRATGRAFTLNEAILKHHLREPHWYLAVLGTDPAAQGQGIGSAVMQPVLARCDAEALPAYLESSKEANIPFYERHGFRVTGEVKVPGGPTLWPMLRDPRASA